MFENRPVDPNQVAAYIRWSTEDQGEGHTLQVQREHCQHVYREHNWVWNEALVFVDAGHSGTVMQRPALNELRKAIANRRVGCVVVYRLDRLSRRTSDTLVLIQDEWGGLCHFVSATEPITTLNGLADVILPIMSSLGEMDRNRIIANTKAGKYAAAKKGRPMGKLPFGYRFGEDGKVEINEAEAAIVRRIFREYLSGAGMTTINRILNAERIPSPQGAMWSPTTVGVILMNEAYIGRLIYANRLVNPRKRRHQDEPRYLHNNEPIVVENAYPRLVSDEEFGAAKRVRTDRSDLKKGRRGLNGRFILSRLAKCGKCGYSMVGFRNSHGYAYYGCHMGLRHITDCDCKTARAEQLEAMVLAKVRAEFSPETRAPLLETARSRRSERLASARSTLASIDAELEKVRMAKKKWIGEFEKNSASVFDPRLISERLNELIGEENQLQAAREKAAQAVKVTGIQSADSDVAAWLEAASALDLWDTITCEQKKHLLRYFVQAISVYVSPDGQKQLDITLNTELLVEN